MLSALLDGRRNGLSLRMKAAKERKNRQYKEASREDGATATAEHETPPRWFVRKSVQPQTHDGAPETLLSARTQ